MAAGLPDRMPEAAEALEGERHGVPQPVQQTGATADEQGQI